MEGDSAYRLISRSDPVVSVIHAGLEVRPGLRHRRTTLLSKCWDRLSLRCDIST